MRGNRYATLAVLMFVHIVTYMDRYTLAGVLTLTQDYFNINNTSIGLVQTVFVLSLTVLSPLFGYLGDRYDRRYIMAVGVSLAAGVTLAGSFVDKQDFWLFLTSRTLVGVGEASFSTVAPSLITDLYVDGQRSLALAIFYLCIPVGSGLGYIIGSYVAHWTGDQWQWAFRVTPGLGFLGILLFLVFLGKPERGQAEGFTSGETTSWVKDLKEICKVWSCMWTLIASALVTFTAGAVAFWFPTMVYAALKSNSQTANITRVSLIFGIFTCVAGVVGVISGAEIARRYRSLNPRSDAIVTGGFMMLSIPFFYVSIYLAGTQSVAMWALFFISEILMCTSFSVQMDIILSVVAPTRRSTADALMVIFSHLFGDASSPYIIGAISDGLTKAFNAAPESKSPDLVRALSLKYALFSLCFVGVLAGGAFLIAGLTLESDRAKVRALCQGYSKLNVEDTDVDIKPESDTVVCPFQNGEVLDVQ